MTTKKYRETHKEQQKTYHRNWNQNHKEQRREYCKKAYRKLKRKYVDMLSGKCQICGYDKCLSALEFHHKDKSKENVYETHSKAFEQKILAGKIQLLCSNCHRELHHPD